MRLVYPCGRYLNVKAVFQFDILDCMGNIASFPSGFHQFVFDQPYVFITDSSDVIWSLSDLGISALSITSEGDDMPIGVILPYGGSVAPPQYLLCQGQLVSRVTYSDLFNVIGTSFSVGDGVSTFGIPDLRAVVPKGAGSQTINTRVKTGPVLGVVEEDAMQGHFHTYGTVFGAGAVVAAGAGLNTVNQPTTSPITDGVNGTPRTGLSTRENSIGVNFIIRYQV